MTGKNIKYYLGLVNMNFMWYVDMTMILLLIELSEAIIVVVLV